MTITDQKGEVVRTLTAPRLAGLNRVYWDLRYEPTREIRMRTSPMYAPHLVTPPEGRSAPGAARLAILAPPGTYTVKLSVGGREFSQPLVVKKDPNSAGTEADIDLQTKMLHDLRRDLNSGADAVNRIESVRSQVESLVRVVEDAAVKKAGTDLNAKLAELEMNLIDLRLTGGQDGVRYASKLLAKIGYLAQQLGGGDFKPTDPQTEVQKILTDQLRTHLAELDGLFEKELGGFNDLLRSKNVPNIIWRVR